MIINESVCFFLWALHGEIDMRNMQKHKDMLWTEDISSITSSVNSRFSYGKQYETALDYVEEQRLDIKALKWCSYTQYADYAYRVFQNTFWTITKL